jgi:hypothetical protein
MLILEMGMEVGELTNVRFVLQSYSFCLTRNSFSFKLGNPL